MSKKVLIIDDNVEICEMYQAIFEIEGYDVRVEYDGLKGLTAAIDFHPDIIILDIMMPQTNGFEVLESIKMHTSLETKILVNSNLTGDADAKKALDLGAEKYLRKADFTPMQVVEAVKNIYKKPASYESKKIMIIDDNVEICEMYRVVLDSQGYEVEVEHNGLNGITAAMSFKPDLILLDIMMPQVDGFEVLDSIKKHSDLQSIVIVNSNLSSVMDEKKALDLGAIKYLRKSDYTPMQVLELIKNILEK